MIVRFAEKFIMGAGIGFAVVVAAVLTLWLGWIPVALSDLLNQDVIVSVAVWLMLSVISFGAADDTRHTIVRNGHSEYLRRALYIALLLGLAFTAFLFSQHIIDDALSQWTWPGSEPVFFLLGLLIGWFVWKLAGIRLYGEFLYVLILTSVIGTCWYAKLAARHDEIRLFAVALIIASLVHLAIDLVRRHEEETRGAGQPEPPRGEGEPVVSMAGRRRAQGGQE